MTTTFSTGYRFRLATDYFRRTFKMMMECFCMRLLLDYCLYTQTTTTSWTCSFLVFTLSSTSSHPDSSLDCCSWSAEPASATLCRACSRPIYVSSDRNSSSRGRPFRSKRPLLVSFLEEAHVILCKHTVILEHSRNYVTSTRVRRAFQVSFSFSSSQIHL